MFQAS
jgi:hypothetical protein